MYMRTNSCVDTAPCFDKLVWKWKMFIVCAPQYYSVAISTEEINKMRINSQMSKSYHNLPELMLKIGGWHQSSAFHLTNLANSFVDKLSEVCQWCTARVKSFVLETRPSCKCILNSCWSTSLNFSDQDRQAKLT